MKGLIFSFAVASALLAFSACVANTHRTYPVGSGDNAQMSGENLSKNGRELAVKQCGNCHRFYFPREYDAESWEIILKQKSKRLYLKEAQTIALMYYFKSESKGQ
ncbi:MAG: hypothetical protein JRI91_09600 [Deltaproteobacteria bacterium]|nr:hypothetical protein [Deltaproteobacteria bacterium]